MAAPAAAQRVDDERRPPGRRRSAPPRTPRRRLLADKIARWTVVGGGLAIIASILAILLFILIEVAPLLGGAKVDAGRIVELDGAPPGAVLCDEHRTHVALLATDGRFAVIDVETGRTVQQQPFLTSRPSADVEPGPSGTRSRLPLEVGDAPGQQLFVAATDAGSVIARPMQWNVRFVGDRRQVDPLLGDAVEFEMDPSGRPLQAFTARLAEDGNATSAAILEDGSLVVLRRAVEENLFSGELTESWQRFESVPPADVEILLLDAAQSGLYGASHAGDLLWWRLVDGRPREPQRVPAGHGGVGALSLLIGDRSLVVGHEDGGVSIWFPVRQDDESFVLTRIHQFAAQGGPVRGITPSLRNKAFLVADAQGGLGLYYSTSERTLWTGRSPVRPATALFFAPKSDGAMIAGAGRVAELAIDSPHPEVSLKALFGKVWYEGYTEPAHVWQSTGGTDDFEPKLSMTPLMIGTLKGTLYSLLLAIPLGVLGAMYTSQFMSHGLKRYVKPTVEIMAALPSVVLGFLAGLWLAPRVERFIPALLLMLVLLPALVVVGGLLWRRLPPVLRDALPDGSEAIAQMVVVALGVWLASLLGGPFEAWVFGGSFPDWLLGQTGLTYDQRNAVVVGLAMGFAVIPIIFSIAEDAFSNVPRDLVSGSLALGANRWQTVTRVVLPSASPGIFSAVMIGFGRAVGETMIVLMATGNTPIMDWNPFNGFRTLSANIAVEIPEAPLGDTLYRTLFLAALILFVFTFVTNTLAEIVRQRLRKRYAQL